METAVSTLSVLPNTKEQIQSFANKLSTELDNGEINPLELLKLKKSIESVFDEIKDKLRDAAITEAEKYGKGKFGLINANFEIKEAGVKYDYSKCNDIVWSDLELKKKEREAFLKALKNPTTIVDETTGDVITLYPPIRKSTTTVQVSL